MRNIKDWLVLLGFILISEGAGLIGTIFTIPSIPTWYAALTKPEVAPPNWVFSPVWNTLFVLMGIAAFIVWRIGKDRSRVRTALIIFFGQLVLNALWSFLFFGAHNLQAALIEIVVLWFAILATIIAFAKVSRTAAVLLIPYIAWVTFASYLTCMFWLLNA